MIADDGHTPLVGLPMSTVPLSAAVLEAADCVVLVTDHSTLDYALVREHSPLLVDARGVVRGMPGAGRLVGLSGAGIPTHGTRFPDRAGVA